MQDDHYPLELEAPDITPYRHGNTGIDYVTSLDSGKAGPHVMLSAVVHGNELCGAIALDALIQNEVRPKQGKLTVAFMNVAAYERFDTADPTASRFVDEDFNRVWSPEVFDGPRDSVELRRARELRPIVDTVDYLLDIHSMQHATTPLMMCGLAEKGRQLALDIGFPPHIVSDAGHAAGRRMRDYADFADDALASSNALLVECGQHWKAASAAVAKETAARFLLHFDMVDPPAVQPLRADEDPTVPAIIEVTTPITIETDSFRFVEDYRGMEVIRDGGTLIAWDGAREVLTPHDHCVLVMPSRRLVKGQTAVRLGRVVS